MSYQTFAPLSNGWRLETGYSPKPEFQVAEEVSELGTIKSTLVAERVRRTWESLSLVCIDHTAYEYLISFFEELGGRAGRFYFAFDDPVPRPHRAPTLEAVAGGSQGSRSISLRYAWKNTAGLTVASPTGTLSVPANELLRVTLPVYRAGCNQAVIYAAEDDPGNEEEQTTLSGERTWTTPDAALLTGTGSPPTTGTATETPLVKLVGDYAPKRAAGQGWRATLSLQEGYA